MKSQQTSSFEDQ
ncbi:unnamed protein product, partial [Rotaria sordida]